MAFTDDDLKRLKELFTLDEYVHRDEIFELAKGLIARLEAAENVCRALDPIMEGSFEGDGLKDVFGAYQAWSRLSC